MPPRRPRASSVATSAKPISSSSTPPTAAPRSIANEPQALSDFASTLDPACFVVCEATGGYESDLLAALLAAGVPAHRADARKVKAFIRSFGTLGKTDAIDARALARYGKDRHAELATWQARDRRAIALAGPGPDPARPRHGSPRLRQSPRRSRRRARRRPISRRSSKASTPKSRRSMADINTLIAQCEPIARALNLLVAIQGVGAQDRRRPHRPHARTGNAHPSPRRRPRRPCPPSQAKRPSRRLSPNARRKTRNQKSPLHGRALRQKTQPDPQGLL